MIHRTTVFRISLHRIVYFLPKTRLFTLTILRQKCQRCFKCFIKHSSGTKYYEHALWLILHNADRALKKQHNLNVDSTRSLYLSQFFAKEQECSYQTGMIGFPLLRCGRDRANFSRALKFLVNSSARDRA